MDKSFEAIAQDIIKNHLSDESLIVGLGSGRAVSKIVNQMDEKIIKRCEFICTSIQIKIEAEKKNLKILDETMVPFIDLVIDGADQIDNNFFMIKGGGGALLREKIVYFSSKKSIIVADYSKFVSIFSRSIPVEVLPFSRTAVIRGLEKLDGEPTLRSLDKGYPYVTENGNLIIDVDFEDYSNVHKLEEELKKIPGILETGLFLDPPTMCYEALEINDFNIHNKKFLN